MMNLVPPFQRLYSYLSQSFIVGRFSHGLTAWWVHTYLFVRTLVLSCFDRLLPQASKWTQLRSVSLSLAYRAYPVQTLIFKCLFHIWRITIYFLVVLAARMSVGWSIELIIPRSLKRRYFIFLIFSYIIIHISFMGEGWYATKKYYLIHINGEYVLFGIL